MPQPLMTHRNCAPRTARSRPASARQSSAPEATDDKITIYIYNVHSSDKLVLRVSAHLQLGSSSTDDAGEQSLKSEIARALYMDASQIRLMFNGSPLLDDERTLKSYGIGDEDTVHLRLYRTPSAGRKDVVLSCAAKKYMVYAERDKDTHLCMRPYAMQPASAKARIDQRCAQNGAALMPRWISQDQPKLFAPVGVSMDGHGGDRVFEEFCSQGVWLAPVDHPNQRGENQYGLQRVRESIASKRGSFGGA